MVFVDLIILYMEFMKLYMPQTSLTDLTFSQK